MDLSTLPEHVIIESTEYKCLQSQFSVLYNESMQMRTQLEEVRGLLQQSKTTHLRQIEGFTFYLFLYVSMHLFKIPSV